MGKVRGQLLYAVFLEFSQRKQVDETKRKSIICSILPDATYHLMETLMR